MWLETLIFGKVPLVLTEHERSEMRKSRTRRLLICTFVWMPLLFGPSYFWKTIASSGAWSSWMSGLQTFVQLGAFILLIGWTLFERSRLRWTHRRAFRDGTHSGLRVCTKCEYPLPAEPLEGVCSECGTPYNPETLRTVWTERYGKLADVQPSTR